MPSQSIISRLVVLGIVLLSFAFIVQASPVAPPDPSEPVTGSCDGNACLGGLRFVPLVKMVRTQVHEKLQSLDQDTSKGVAIFSDVAKTIREGTDFIEKYKLKRREKLTGDIVKVALLWNKITIETAIQFKKWASIPEVEGMYEPELIDELDKALDDLLVAIKTRSKFSKFVAYCAKSFTKAQLHTISLWQSVSQRVRGSRGNGKQPA